MAMTKSKGAKKPNRQQKVNKQPKVDDIQKNERVLSNGKNKGDDLLKEIITLGGSKEDLKLLENIDDNGSEELVGDASAPQVVIPSSHGAHLTSILINNISKNRLDLSKNYKIL
jgi:hypothetical protein